MSQRKLLNWLIVGTMILWLGMLSITFAPILAELWTGFSPYAQECEKLLKAMAESENAILVLMYQYWGMITLTTFIVWLLLISAARMSKP